MIVTYQGGESFKISQGDLSVSVNPTSNRGKSDIVLLSTTNADLSPEGFVISGPGEYEVKDVSIKGFLSKSVDEKINTIYMVNFEGMNLCILGSLAQSELPAETLEHLEDIDILFAPVGASKLAVSLEPALIIPTSYTPDTLKKFVKDAGEDKIDPIDKLVIKKKDLEGKEGEIVILKQE